MALKDTLGDFKKFIQRGNVMDMAVGVVIGGAFSSIVSSLVSDIITPIIGLFTKGVDFTSLFIALDGNHYATLQEAIDAQAAVLTYGQFISKVIDFFIIALVIFFMLKGLTKLKKQEEPTPAPAPTTKKCPYCQTDIPLEATRCPHCTSVLEEPEA